MGLFSNPPTLSAPKPPSCTSIPTHFPHIPSNSPIDVYVKINILSHTVAHPLKSCARVPIWGVECYNDHQHWHKVLKDHAMIRSGTFGKEETAHA
jgi:hypothetical protein